MSLPMFLKTLEVEKVIISVKEPKHLERALASEKKIVFLLTGNIGVIKSYVDLFKQQGCFVFLHMDKIGGLQCDREGLEFVASYIQPTGIISTKNSVIRQAKKLKLITIQRQFLIDTSALIHGIQSIAETQPDAVEVMPARIPSLINRIQAETKLPIISGGLLENREQMLEMIHHGAKAVSTGSPELWEEQL